MEYLSSEDTLEESRDKDELEVLDYMIGNFPGYTYFEGSEEFMDLLEEEAQRKQVLETDVLGEDGYDELRNSVVSENTVFDDYEEMLKFSCREWAADRWFEQWNN